MLLGCRESIFPRKLLSLLPVQLPFIGKKWGLVDIYIFNTYQRKQKAQQKMGNHQNRRQVRAGVSFPNGEYPLLHFPESKWHVVLIICLCV